MKRNRSVIQQLLVSVIGLVMLFTVAAQPILAYTDNGQSITFEFSGQTIDPYLVLNLFEKKVDGSTTQNPIAGAKFELYKGTTPTGSKVGTYTTDDMGQVVIDSVSIGNYYFVETAPTPICQYEQESGVDKTEYPFVVTAADVANGYAVVNAYNTGTAIKDIFPDSILAEKMAEVIDGDINTIITDYVLNQITSLDLSNLGIKSISGLEHLSQLKELDISKNMISNIRNLNGLTKLKKVDASDQTILLTDTAPTTLVIFKDLWGIDGTVPNTTFTKGKGTYDGTNLIWATSGDNVMSWRSDVPGGEFSGTVNQTVSGNVSYGALQVPVVGYKGTTYVINPDGSVSSWGDDSVHQLGRNGSGSTHGKITFSGGEMIAEVVTGYQNGKTMYALTTNGDVYSWGTGVDGTLGTGVNGIQSSPTKVKLETGGDLANVKRLVLGYDGGHTMYAITTDNKVYAWGYGDASGMLGTGDTSSITKAKLVIDQSGTVLSSISNVYSGNRTTFAVSQDKKTVYSWGDNTKGQLGRAIGTKDKAASLSFSGKEMIREIVSGYNHETLYAITTNGYVYSWGTGTDGTLGTDMDGLQALPTKVKTATGGLLQKVKSLVLGYESGHTIYAETTNNQVYAWGYGNKSGMLGTGDNAPIKTAKQIINQNTDNLAGVTTVVPGYTADGKQTIVAASSTNDKVYTWGDNSYNQLAAGDSMNGVWRNRKAITIDAIGDGGTWKADETAWQLDVEVPIGLTFSADASGNITLPTDPNLSIKNYSSQPVTLVEADYTEGDWKLVNTSPNQTINSKEFKIGASFGNSNDLLTVIKKELPNQVVWGSTWSTQGNASIDLALSSGGPIAPQTAIRTQSAGAINFVLDWF